MTPQLGRAPASEEMARWFEALIGVQRAAASSPDFFAETARAVVELIGLDCGLVLLRREGQWVPVACHPAHDDAKSQFSRSIIETVVDQRRTFYQGGQFQPAVASLLGVTAVVASPVLDECQEVIGVVYGARRGAGSSPEIRPLEGAVDPGDGCRRGRRAGAARKRGAGRAPTRAVRAVFHPRPGRRPRSRPSATRRPRARSDCAFCRYPWFFRCLGTHSPKARLRADSRYHGAPHGPHHGISRGRRRLRRRRAAGNVEVPAEQPDHAARACRAALAMRGGLPELNRRWEGRLGKAIGLGIGINSGAALVGNTGSRQKFKYGPLGHTVNLASRVEGATKHLGVGR